MPVTAKTKNENRDLKDMCEYMSDIKVYMPRKEGMHGKIKLSVLPWQ
jgi:hypothetical protein